MNTKYQRCDAASLFVVALLSGLSASGQIVIDGSNIGTSAMIPAQGETVTWLVPLLNDGEERWQGKAHVTMRVARRGQALAEPVEVVLSFSCNQAVGYGFPWPHPGSGFTPETHQTLTQIYQRLWGSTPPPGA